MSGFDSDTPMAPIVPPKYLSVTGSQVLPPSVLLNTPPPVVPNQYSLGRAAEPAAATLRPPRKMPISRQLSAANTVVSNAWAAAGRGHGDNRHSVTATSSEERADTGRGLRKVGGDRVTHISTERPTPARPPRQPAVAVRNVRVWWASSCWASRP